VALLACRRPGWDGQAVSFFEQFTAVPPAEPEPEPERPPWFKPQAQLPAVVPVELVLARTEAAAVLLSAVRAYRTGFEFTVVALVRERIRSGRRLESVHAHPPAGVDPGPDFLRFGLRFADGRSAANLPHSEPPDTGDPASAAPMLMRQHGSGDGQRWEHDFWVWPLPPPGPLAFVCQWPALEIPESAVEIDAGLVLDAAARSYELWPGSDASV
jgi:hypothetical protein